MTQDLMSDEVLRLEGYSSGNTYLQFDAAQTKTEFFLDGKKVAEVDWHDGAREIGNYIAQVRDAARREQIKKE